MKNKNNDCFLNNQLIAVQNYGMISQGKYYLCNPTKSTQK